VKKFNAVWKDEDKGREEMRVELMMIPPGPERHRRFAFSRNSRGDE